MAIKSGYADLWHKSNGEDFPSVVGELKMFGDTASMQANQTIFSEKSSENDDFKSTIKL